VVDLRLSVVRSARLLISAPDGIESASVETCRCAPSLASPGERGLSCAGGDALGNSKRTGHVH
jgi:hypothetical protein